MKACDIMENPDNREINFVYTKRYPLTERVLQNICDSIKRKYGLEVGRVEENENGYVFYSKHGYTIGDISYNPQAGHYNEFYFHNGVIENETIAHRQEIRDERSRKFKLQRRKTLWRLTAAAIAFFVAIGIFKALPKNPPAKDPIPIVEQHLNTIDSADDLILVSWANYAIGEISSKAEKSSYDYVHTQRNELYEAFTQVMINYYNYVDQIESGLPQEIVGSLIEKYHKEFRNAAAAYNEAIKKSMFSEEVFSQSPYADAAILTQAGQNLGKGKYEGELVDQNNKVILDDTDANYTIFIQATDTNNNYSIDNLPEDAVIYNNEVYVSEDYLNGINPSSPGMK